MQAAQASAHTQGPNLGHNDTLIQGLGLQRQGTHLEHKYEGRVLIPTIGRRHRVVDGGGCREAHEAALGHLCRQARLRWAQGVLLETGLHLMSKRLGISSGQIPLKTHTAQTGEHPLTGEPLGRAGRKADASGLHLAEVSIDDEEWQ